MQYLTRLSIEGLKRLRKNGDFTRPRCVNQALAQYQTYNDEVLQFLEVYADRDNMEGKAVATVYRVFTEWSLENGYTRPINNAQFSQRIKAITGLATKSKRNKVVKGLVEKVYYDPRKQPAE